MFRRQPELHVSVGDDTLTVSGPHLEEALAEVHRRCGDDAEILDARRSIVGGVAGFFGKEWFELVARRPGDDGAATGGDAGEAAGEVPDRAGEGAVESVDDGVDGRTFAAALAEALARHDAPIDGPDAPAAVPRATLEELLTSLTARSDATAPGLDGTAGPAGDAAGGTRADPVVDAFEEAAPDAAAPGPAVLASPPSPAPSEPAPTAPAATEPAPAGPAPGATAGPAGAVPAFHVHLCLPDQSVGELLERIDPLLPPPLGPPDRGIVAVVGDADDAVLTAERLARRSGDLDRDGVVLLAPEARDGRAPWMVVTSVAEAGARRRRWARRPGCTFVAVAMDPGEPGLSWARAALDALAPAQIRFAAPAWRGPDELLPRLQALGRVDAVDLVHLESSVDPGEFLAVEPPVATLEGRPAEAGLWAAYLLSAPTPLGTTTLADPHAAGRGVVTGGDR